MIENISRWLDRGGMLYGIEPPLGDSFWRVTVSFTSSLYQSRGESCVSNMSQSSLKPSNKDIIHENFSRHYLSRIVIFFHWTHSSSNTLKDLTL